jgi:hypothetical protein
VHVAALSRRLGQYLGDRFELLLIALKVDAAKRYPNISSVIAFTFGVDTPCM